MPSPTPHPQSPSPIRHVPEDLIVTVDANVTVAALQRALAERGQWLPVDPPGDPTLRATLDHNLSGPRRYGYGTIRELVLGLTMRLRDGRVIKAGGQVVKNVAGYDLCRLFTGAGGTLGEILEATFKLQPLPEAEQTRQRVCATLAEAAGLINAVLDAAVTPVILDLVSPATVIVGFAGMREDVAWQVAEAQRLGFEQPAPTNYDRPFPTQTSVLPSRLIETVRALAVAEFVARAGNGVIHHHGAAPALPTAAADELARRVREVFGA